MKHIDTLIIGAGISGLSYAINTSEDYVIFEKEGSAGGLCRTIHKQDYIWDYSGHFFHFTNPDIRRYFDKQTNPDDIIVCKKNTNINYHGLKIDYPFQMNIHQLPKNEFIDCLYDLFNRSEDTYYSFKSMLYSKFGKSITEKFLKPYNEKLYACDLDELDVDAMGRFFPYADEKQIINNMKNGSINSYNSYFEYPKQGAQYFVDLLLKQINNNRIIYNSMISHIDLNKKTVDINNEQYCFNRMINTSPLKQFIKLLDIDFSSYNIESLSCNKVLVLNLGFDRQSNDTNTHWTYIPMSDIRFYRVGYYSNILQSEKMSLYVEIGFKENDTIDVDQELKQTITDLKKLGIIQKQQLVSYCALVIDPAYVHITKESNKTVKNVLNFLRQYNIDSIGRYGKWTYCSIEDCIIDAFHLADENSNRQKGE